MSDYESVSDALPVIEKALDLLATSQKQADTAIAAVKAAAAAEAKALRDTIKERDAQIEALTKYVTQYQQQIAKMEMKDAVDGDGGVHSPKGRK